MKIEVKDLSVPYVERRLFGVKRQEVLKNVSFSVNSGERVVVLASNGAGKSTLISAICNLLPAYKGVITIGGEETHVALHGKHTYTKKPWQLPVRLVEGMGIYPYQNVAKNISYRLEIQGISEEEQVIRLMDAARRVGVAELLLPDAGRRRASEFSSGQVQRIILARLLADIQPVLLFDEPLAHVDFIDRVRLCNVFRSVFAEYNSTVLYVTHDPDEALRICDTDGRLLVLEDGQVDQFDYARNVIKSPKGQTAHEFAEWVNEHEMFYGRFAAGGDE